MGVKGIAVFLVILGLCMVANAINAQWVLDFSKKGDMWRGIDLLIASGLFFAALGCWDAAKRRELRRLAHEHGALNGSLNGTVKHLDRTSAN